MKDIFHNHIVLYFPMIGSTISLSLLRIVLAINDQICIEYL